MCSVKARERERLITLIMNSFLIRLDDRALLLISVIAEIMRAAVRFVAVAVAWLSRHLRTQCNGDKSTVIATRRGKDTRENYCYPVVVGLGHTMERTSGADPASLALLSSSREQLSRGANDDGDDFNEHRGQ